jgi:o-succinylbenzoate synthase
VSLAVRIESFRSRLVAALHTGFGPIRERTGFLVGLDDGTHVGWGDASPLPGWSIDSVAATERALRQTLALVTTDTDVTAALEHLDEHPHARAAVAGAWADLRARRDGVPLAASLSDGWRREVEVNAVLTASEPRTLEADAAAAVASGFGSLKLKVGTGDPVGDIERIRAARRGGPGAEIRLDANRAWDRETAVETLRAVAEADVAWCEEPTSNPGEFNSIEAATGVRVAIDESVRTESDLLAALTSGIAVVVLKPQALGGPDRAERVARRAHDSGATVVVTSFMDSAIGVAHALHAASAFGDPIAHGLATASLLEDDVGPSPTVRHGTISLSRAAGLGVDPEIA